MRVAMLGSLRVRGGDDAAIEVGGARLRLLLVRLALDAGRVVTVERLVADLWEGEPPADPAGALQTLVARLRRLFADERSVIVSRPGGYLLDVVTDVQEFERAAAGGRRALGGGDSRRAARLLRGGLALWRGAPLGDAGNAAFALAPVARLRETRLAMVEDRIAAELTHGAPVAIPEVEELVQEHPLRERLQARLVQALTAAGRRAEALDAYERVRRELADRLGVDPGSELKAAHLAALRADDAPVITTGATSRAADTDTDTGASTATATGSRTPAGTGTPAGTATTAGPGEAMRMPVPATGFVGRDAELAGLRAALWQARLVTVVGFGGTGKTRLAVEVAARWHETARLVELGDVADPARVVPAVVAAVAPAVVAAAGAAVGDVGAGVFGADLEPRERLIAMLAGRRLLLVLDNCEHVIDAAASLAEHLLAATEVTILVTSREPLAIPGETLFPLSPLGLPGPGDDPGEAPAVRLFAERAKAVRPGFSADQETTGEDVVRVCRALDGIPLAIELAAARLRSLTLTQLAARIGDRFAVLERGSRTARARHRTLRAVVDWSWDLLEAEERAVLRRLSVFLGGATAEAAAYVCEPAGDPTDILAGLVDKSLLVLAEDDLGARYRLLETVRAYAAERLEEAGETAATRRRHSAYFLTYAETAEPFLRGRDQLDRLARLDAEQGNLDAALDQAITTGDTEGALALVLARTWPWIMRGRRREASGWARAALTLAGDAAPPGHELAYAICVLLAPVEEDMRIMAALEVTQRSDRPAALGAWALAGGYAGDSAEIRARAAAVAGRFAGHPDPWLRAMAAMAAGLVELEYTPGGAGRAEEHLRAALDGFTAIGDRWGQATCLFALGLVLANRGSWPDTVRVLERARSRAVEIGGAEEIPVPMMLLVQLGQARGRAGDLAGARADLEQALAAAERAGDPLGTARVRHALGDIAYAAGDPAGAAAHLRAALTGVPEDEAPAQFLALLHISAATAETALGDHDRAAGLRERALTLVADTGDDVARASVLEAAAGQSGPEDAVALLAAARTLRGIEETGDPGVRALLDRCRAELGEDRFATAWTRGRRITRPESVARRARVRR